MKRYNLLLLALILTMSVSAQPPRLLITTDIGGDPDDQQSLVRLMVYANEFDIEGIICSAAGTPGELGKSIIRPDLVEEIIKGYSGVYLNLLKHDKAFPAPDFLLSVLKKGNPNRGWENVGEGHNTEGSEWIIRQVDKKDKRPLNICIFGGQTDLAQALWNVKNSRSAKEFQQFISKIRVYDINDQDKVFPKLYAAFKLPFYVLAKAPEGIDKREGAYRGVYLGGDESLTSLAWLKENALENHGPLGKLYPTKTWTAPNPHGVMKEGDTPSWFFFLKNGLNITERPELGGWGGRFIRNEQGYFSDATDSFGEVTNARATVFRWRADFQNDWAARMDWCVGDYQNCNHAPVVSVNGSTGKELLVIKANSNETVELDASASTDPDGNSLHFEWLSYPETANVSGEMMAITGSGNASVKMAGLEKGKKLHLVLKVTDNGKPNLTSYKRIDLILK